MPPEIKQDDLRKYSQVAEAEAWYLAFDAEEKTIERLNQGFGEEPTEEIQIGTREEIVEAIKKDSYAYFVRRLTPQIIEWGNIPNKVELKEIRKALQGKASALSNQQIEALMLFLYDSHSKSARTDAKIPEEISQNQTFFTQQALMNLGRLSKTHVLENYINLSAAGKEDKINGVEERSNTLDFVFENFGTEINNLCRRYKVTPEKLLAVLKSPSEDLELARRLVARSNFMDKLRSCIPRAQLADLMVPKEKSPGLKWENNRTLLDDWDGAVRYFLSHPQLLTTYSEARVRREFDMPKSSAPNIMSTEEIGGIRAQENDQVMSTTLDSIYEAHAKKIDAFLTKYGIDWSFLIKSHYTAKDLLPIISCYDQFTQDLVDLLPNDLGGATDLVNNVWARQVASIQFAFLSSDFIELTRQQKEDFKVAFEAFQKLDASNPENIKAIQACIGKIQAIVLNDQEYKDIFTHDTRGALSGLAYYECLMPDTNGFDQTQIFEGKDGVDDEENAKKAIFALLHFERICEYLLQGDTPKAEPHSFKELRRTIQSLGFYFEGSESKVEIQEMRETDRANFDRLRLSVNLPLLHRTIFGAINNAFKRGKASQVKIRFETETKENNLLIHIEDNGRGVDSLLLEEDESGNKPVFNKGVSGGEGTGLGLDDVKKRTQEVGGDIDLMNNKGESGATTTITLPLSNSASTRHLAKQIAPALSASRNLKPPSEGEVVQGDYAGEHEAGKEPNQHVQKYVKANEKTPEDA